MQIIDEQVYEDHFVEVTIQERELNQLIKHGELKQKISCNNEIISFAIIIEHDKSAIVDPMERQEKKFKYR